MTPPRPLNLTKPPISARTPAPRPEPVKQPLITDKQISTKSTNTNAELNSLSKSQLSGLSSTVNQNSTGQHPIKKSVSKFSDVSQLESVDTLQATKKEQLQQHLETLEENQGNTILSYFEDIAEKIRQRLPEEGWPWVVSPPVDIPESLQTRWKAEGSLFSAIAMLEFYDQQYVKGEIDPELYHHQLKSLLTEAIQLRFKLEKNKDFDFEHFILREKLQEYFPNGLKKLKLADGSSKLDFNIILKEGAKINYKEMTKLPAKAADYVSNTIELIDLIRLRAVATTDRILPLLDEIYGILSQTTDLFGSDYWALKEIDSWRIRLEKEPVGTILSDNELDQLEMQCVRWMNDFRRELKNL